MTSAVAPTAANTTSTSSFMTRRNSSQRSVPPPLKTIPRSRTTSLFTSVTSPFSGRMSFGTPSNSTQSKAIIPGTSLENTTSSDSRTRSLSSNEKSKEQETYQSNNRSTKPPKSKSALLAKRLSSPTSPSSPPQFSISKPQMESRWSEDSAMGGYLKKAETLSKSSPDLSNVASFQPWPTLEGESQEFVEKSRIAGRRRSRVLSGSNITRYAHKAAKSFSSILLPNSPKSFNSSNDYSSRTLQSQVFTSSFSPLPHSTTLSTDEYLSQSIIPSAPQPLPDSTTTSFPSILPSSDTLVEHSRIPSPSPSPTTANRLAARAAALAKLTEPPPIISLKRKVSPAPESSLDRPSLAVIDTSSSSGNERKSMSSSDINTQNGKEGASRWSDDTNISGAVTPNTPSRLSTSSILSSYHQTQARSSQNSSRDSGSLPPRPRKASARTKSYQQRAAVLAGLEEEIVQEEVRKAKKFLEGEFGSGIWQSKRVGTEKYEKEDQVEEENLWSVIRNGVLLCR